ncbi:hypothetical protein PHSC3_000695 [Chlamydiales bacterium STE3]|nr:hypothetical protein PHSC3_000695 [Chlamydiales bacterium STE3]
MLEMSFMQLAQQQRRGCGGCSQVEDGSLDFKVSTPKELGGAGGPGNNPEQLFAAGYSACFLGALKLVAGQNHQQIPKEATVSATVGIGPRSEGGFGLEVSLDISLPGVEYSNTSKSD